LIHNLRIRRLVYTSTVMGRSVQLFHSAKQRAKKNRLPFTITKQMVYDRLVALNGIAEVIPDSFDFTALGDGRQNPYAPSIDQKIPGQGYTPENFQIVVFWYNRVKGSSTDEEALTILQNANIPHQFNGDSIVKV